MEAQERAIVLAEEYGMSYITGMELNVTFPYRGKDISLDFLGYHYDLQNQELKSKLNLLREYREGRACQILEKLNTELEREGRTTFIPEDLKKIQENVDGALGRPHIADYLVKKEIVSTRQEAFDRYLVKCDVPKYPLSLAEASRLVRNAGGILVLAHPSDPNGTSLASISSNLQQQTTIIAEFMLKYTDGVECWHSRNDGTATAHYVEFAKKHGLVMTGGSDCHQRPVIMGTLDIPDYVARQSKLLK